MTGTDGLDKLDLTPVPVNPAWAVGVSVTEAASVQGILLTVADDRADLACEQCGQSVMRLRVGPASYRLTAAAISGSVLMHLMQAHHWERETIGDRSDG